MSGDPVTAIVALLQNGRPSAIARFVVAVVVDPVKRVAALGSLPHVLKEVLERVPTFADRNPSGSIDGIPPSAGILASLNHGVPRPVLDGVFGFRATEAALDGACSPDTLSMHFAEAQARAPRSLAPINGTEPWSGGGVDRNAPVVPAHNQRVAIPSPAGIVRIAPSAFRGALVAAINNAGFEGRLRGHRGPFTVSRPRLFAAARGLFASLHFITNTPDGGICVPNVGCYSLPSRD